MTCATCAYSSRVNSSTSWSTSSQVSHRTRAVLEASRVLGGGAELWRLAAARNGHCVVGPLFCLQNLTLILLQPWQFCDSSMLASLSPVTPAQYASTFGSNLCRSKHQLLVTCRVAIPCRAGGRDSPRAQCWSPSQTQIKPSVDHFQYCMQGENIDIRTRRVWEQDYIADEPI